MKRESEFCLAMTGELDKDKGAQELIRSLARLSVNGGVGEVMLILVASSETIRSEQLCNALKQLPQPPAVIVRQEDSLEEAVKKQKPNYVYHAFSLKAAQVIGRGDDIFFGPSSDGERYVANYVTVVEPQRISETSGTTKVRIVSSPGADEFSGRTLYLPTTGNSEKDSA